MMRPLTSLRVTRRGLQVALGLLWLLDGALQLQPFMFETGFAREVIAPAASGQPHLVAGPVGWAADVIASHPAGWNALFASVQLLLGLGLLVRRTAPLALAASLPWVAGVWLFGEGLGGLLGGQTSLLTGAPGSVLLYGVLALAAWPSEGRADVPPARWLPLAWATLWIGGALLQALTSQNSGDAVAASIRDGADGAPHWLGRLNLDVAGWIGNHGTVAVAALVVGEALIGLAALGRESFGFAVRAGLLLSLPICVLGQDLGQLYSGQATDPGSAPLIALMAVALLFGRQRPDSRNQSHPDRRSA